MISVRAWQSRIGDGMDAAGREALARELVAGLFADAQRAGSAAMYPALILHMALEARAWSSVVWNKSSAGIAADTWKGLQVLWEKWRKQSRLQRLGDWIREQHSRMWMNRQRQRAWQRDGRESDRQLLHLILVAAALALALVLRLLLSAFG